MFSWFQIHPEHDNKVNFENVQHAIQKQNNYILINTLDINEQDCLIFSTIDASTEEKIINEMISDIRVPDKKIIIYGKNTNDISAEKKYKQLRKLGIQEVYIYSGGMFEWLLLQDIYGFQEFPTSKKVIDILKYKPCSINI